MEERYKLRYLPLFYEDLESAIRYILIDLKNENAAKDMLEAVENSILERLPVAEAFEPYHSPKERCYPYYRIYVKNYVVYYVVIEENGDKIMEVRRLLYKKRKINLHI